MGQLIRSFGWSSTSVGEPSKWPQALRTAVRLMLATNHPMFIFWGADHICLYNDAYKRSIGPEKHPSMLGSPGREMWGEIWDIIGPQIEQVMQGRGATWHEDALVPIIRNGILDQVYWTYGYSPIDHDDRVGGVLVICTETTQSVLAAKRQSAELERLRDLFQKAPSFACYLVGREHRFEFVNEAFQSIIGPRELIGKTVPEAVPEVVAQGFVDLLTRVYETGEPHIGNNTPVVLARLTNARAETRIVDFIFQAVRDSNDVITGVFVEGYDVTERQAAENRLRDTHTALEENQKHLRLLIEESNHRVKNTLALVQALAHQTLRDKDVPERIRTTFNERLAALAAAHNVLIRQKWTEANLADIVRDALKAHHTTADRFKIEGPPLQIGPKAAVAVAMALHELSTNATKYGALSTDHGRVHFSWEPIDTREAGVRMRWEETGGPTVTAPARKGFGSRMLETALASELRGEVKIDYHPTGVICHIEGSVTY